jgi:predicted secreted protein
MTITSAIVVYAVVWFMALFVALPIRIRTQGETGEVVPGTPASAPAEAHFRRKLVWATIATTILWGLIVAVILWGGITVRDLDFWGRMG